MKRLITILMMGLLMMPELMAIQSGASTQGSEFYFTFMRGRRERAKDLKMFVASETNGKLELTNPMTGTTSTYTIQKGALLEIPLASVPKNTDEVAAASAASGNHKDCYTVIANAASNTGYYAHATDGSGNDIKVSLFISMSGSKTADAANVYPIEALGNDYYVVSRSGNTGDDGDSKFNPSEAVIVATEDCVVDIYPTCMLKDVSTTAVPEKIEVSLKRGQVYQLFAASSIGKYSTDGLTGTNDLTGTRIVLKDDGNKNGNKCKKVAVFSGTRHGSGENSAWNNGDYEFDQLFPVHLWGKRFVVGSPDSYGSATTRIVAAEPCTKVKVNGVDVATLNQSEFYEYKDAGNVGCYVEASKPVGVAFFTTGENVGSSADGAPAMITIAPVEQMVQEMMFNAIENEGITEHSLMITAPTDSCIKTVLTENGTNKINLETGWTPIAANADYSYYVYAGLNTASTYKLESPKGFNAYVYGSKGKDVGYGYSVGSAAVTAKTSFNVGDLDVSEINLAMCMDAGVVLTPTLPGAVQVNQVRWTVSEATPSLKPGTTDEYTFAVGTQVFDSIKTLDTYNKTFDCVATLDPKFYEVRMIVSKTVDASSQACFSDESASASDTVYTHFFVKDNKGGLRIDTTVCLGKEIVLPSHSVGLGFPDGDASASLNHYEWYVDSVDVMKKNLIVAGTSPQALKTIDLLKQGIKDSLFIMSSYNDKNKCMTYEDSVWVSIPSTISTNLLVTAGDGKISDDQKEIKFCNEGGKNVSITGTYSRDTAVTTKGESYTPKWTRGSTDVTTSVTNWNTDNGVYTYAPTMTENTYYTVEVKDETGTVCQTTIPLDVRVVSVPKYTVSIMGYDATKGVSANPITLRQTGGDLTLSATITPMDPATTYLYRWFRRDGVAEGVNEDISEGDYYVKDKYLGVVDKKGFYTVTTTDGDSLCAAEATINVSVDELHLQTVIDPRRSGAAFGEYTLPDSGATTSATVQSIVGDYTLYIFDRYGKKVSETHNAGWSSSDMQKVDAGVYFYLIESKSADGEKNRIKGSIEIVKNE